MQRDDRLPGKLPATVLQMRQQLFDIAGSSLAKLGLDHGVGTLAAIPFNGA